VKQSGLGDNLYIHGYDVSGDINSVNVAGGPAALDVTGIDKGANERIGGLRTGAMGGTTFFNPGTDRAHPRLSTLPRTDVIASYFRGTTLGKPAACQVSKQVNYDGTRGDDGAFTFTFDLQCNGFGVEWGRSLTAGVRTDTEATDGASIDTAASADFGAQAYLQAFAFDGTDVTVKIQDSADDATFADVTGLSFTELTAGNTAERIATANDATIRRYLRVITETTGGFNSLAFAVVVVKNEVEGVVF
jgi:hypothetical protein